MVPCNDPNWKSSIPQIFQQYINTVDIFLLPLCLTTLASAGTVKERATFVECIDSEKQMAQAATFFKTTDSTSTNHMTEILDKIAQESSQQGSGLSGAFTQTGYASTDGYRGRVNTCPAYYQLPQVSDDCSVLAQRMSSLHELSHTKGVLGFKVYGYTNILNLDTQTALKNAESYAFFSKCEFLFFPGGPVG
ncbi:hypothetical protein BDV29DRAFT_195601 [Aspergillus leporis]|uniref:Lysine-specific metallo-endopeptidase domain-containing protein n=1 Tax=Aspergillus leporis TaxID=41062 RepID=A0A5N5WJ74_9EURO|nr:hypothetical protein BDV29DRAFT_195601 [Aspergillus leporis]